MAHHGCEYTDVSGWTLVEVVSGRCEVGQGCDGLKAGCPFAWKENDFRQTRTANRIFADFCQRLANQPLMSLQ